MNSTELKKLKIQSFCPPIPKGYRELKKGEMIILGDCFYSPAQKNIDKTLKLCYISGSNGYLYKSYDFKERTKMVDGQNWIVFREIE